MQLCFPLYAAARAVTKTYAELLQDSGLTYPQYLVVLVLLEQDQAVSVGDLGTALRLDSGTLTPLLKRLEAAGIVRRQRDPEDERRVLVELTEAGRALEDDLAQVPARLGSAMGISIAEATQLRAQLITLIDNLDRAAQA